MPPPATGPSSSTSTATTPATNPPATNPASTTSTTSTAASLAKPSSKQPQKTAWQIFKKLLPSSGAIQVFMGLVGLVLTILGIKWAVQSYHIARWTELKDFRDDCRSVQASGGPFSIACEEALRRELEPPPYAPSYYFNRLRERDFNAIRAKEGIYEVVIVVRRDLRVCREALLREGRELLFVVRSLETTKAATRAVLQAWQKITSVAELVGISKEAAALWISALWSWMTSITLSGRRLLVDVWANARILRPLIMSASQWARHQTTEFPHYAQRLSKVLSPWLRALSSFSKNSSVRKVVSFFLHPWTFDGALCFLSTAKRFLYHTITSFQYVLFLNILLVHHLILWPFWCDGCHGTWWRIITLLSDAVCCALILVQGKQANYNKRRANYVGAYSPNMTAAMIGIELGYEILLLVHGFRHSFTTFGILFASVLFLTIWFFYSRNGKLYNPLAYLSMVLFTHVIESFLLVNVYSSGLGTWRGVWGVTSSWLLKFVIVLFWICYGIDMWALFTLILKRDLTLHKQRRAAGY